jgi:hypothetical protein
MTLQQIIVNFVVTRGLAVPQSSHDKTFLISRISRDIGVDTIAALNSLPELGKLIGYSGRFFSVSDQSTTANLESRNTPNFILDEFSEIKERLVARPESANYILRRIVVQLGDHKLNQFIQHVEESVAPEFRESRARCTR